MTKLFERAEGFPYINWGEGFVIGMIMMILLSSLIPSPAKPSPIIEEPVVQTVEKPVIIKEPVYLNHNDRREIQCLAENAYFEAGNQTRRGKIAVTNVVMNRIADPRFPKTACAVIYQKARGVCQFSWVCQGKKRIRDMKMFAEARAVAEDVYLRNVGDITRGAKFYHANYVNPRWNLRRVITIGDHIFYNYRV